METSFKAHLRLRNRLTDIGNKVMVAGWERGWGAEKGEVIKRYKV